MIVTVGLTQTLSVGTRLINVRWMMRTQPNCVCVCVCSDFLCKFPDVRSEGYSGSMKYDN